MSKKVSIAFDEMRAQNGAVRPLYQGFDHWLKGISHEQLMQKSREAELLFRRVGITFNVYGEEAGAERLIPFDVVPRILAASEWKRLSEGAIQRVRALNAFLNDLYHGQEIIKAGIMPASILNNEMYRPEMQGVDVPGGIYAHIAGIDIVRDRRGSVLRAGGQPAYAVRSFLHAGRSQDDDAAVPGTVSRAIPSPRSNTTRTCF